MLARFRPHRIARSLIEVDCEELLARGVRGIILDLDNTITGWHCMDVPPEAVDWVTRVRALGLRACVVSNAATVRRVRPVAEELELPWVTRALKPLPQGFIRGMRMMETTPETTAMIGDQLFTDILGGNLLGLFTVLVEPYSAYEGWTTRLQRPLERLVHQKRWDDIAPTK